MTIKEATELWVRRDMVPIPESVVEKLFAFSDGTDMGEVTPPAIGNRISFPISGEVAEMRATGNGDYEYLVKSDDGIAEWYPGIELDVDHYDMFPMWGTLWNFAGNLDKEWLDCPENLLKMANCGFRIYESEDYGYIFGIDGAGYDFYESHWIPLYKARGLEWHDKEDVKA